jgi:hypothetical protein
VNEEPDGAWHPRAKLYFHLALGAVPLILACVPVVLGLAVAGTWHRESHPDRKRWVLALWALAAIDVVLVAGLVAAVPSYAAILRGETEELSLTSPIMRNVPPSGPRIGVGLEDADDDEGAQVTRVVPGSPADTAGILAGDIIVRVDDRAIKGFEDLQSEITSGAPDAPRAITVERGDEILDLTVVPTDRVTNGVGFFDAQPGSECDPVPPGGGTWAHAALLGFVVPLWLWVGLRSRRPGRWGLHIWPALVAILVFGMAIAPATTVYAMCTVRGGVAEIDGVVALHAQMLAVLSGGGLWLGFVSRRESLEFRGGAPMRAGRVYVLGLVYLLASVARIGAAVFILATLAADEPTVPGESPIENFIAQSVRQDWLGTGLLILAIAVVGPIAEEVVFRGVLLPWMGGHLSPAWAIILTSGFFAILHSHYGLRMFAIFAIGVVLGWARYRSGGLKIPILLHITVNAASAVGILVE